MYVFLVGPMGATGSPQAALECWIAGAIVLLLLETSAFEGPDFGPSRGTPNGPPGPAAEV